MHRNRRCSVGPRTQNLSVTACLPQLMHCVLAIPFKFAAAIPLSDPSRSFIASRGRRMGQRKGNKYETEIAGLRSHSFWKRLRATELCHLSITLAVKG